MSDPTEGGKPLTPPEHTKRESPVRLTPSPELAEPDSKPSRKRGREVSIEPATTPSAANDDDPMTQDRKDSTIRKKKGRRLDATEEEEESAGSASGSGSGSPSTPPSAPTVMTSPRQEMKRKVRQISRGVEDINWKNRKTTSSDQESKLDVDIECAPPEPPQSQSQDVLTNTQGSEESNQELVDQETMAEEEDSPPKTPDDSVLSRSVQDVQNSDSAIEIPPSSDANDRLGVVGSETNEKGLKRKFLERGTSHGPPDAEEIAKNGTESIKRPRDESDKDDNPRETKRPTPPPSPPRPSSSPKAAKKSGFMAYASTSSPFASVKGQNIFTSSKSATSFTTTTTTTTTSTFPSTLSTPASDDSPVFGQTSSVKHSGFESFASSSSPFATAAHGKPPAIGSVSKLGRAKSPPRSTAAISNSNPFASYAGSGQGFALAFQGPKKSTGTPESSLERNPQKPFGVFAGGGSTKESDSGDEEEREDGNMTFGEKLRAGKDEEEEVRSDEEKVKLTEQDMMTGEEEEETIHQVRGKLFSLENGIWKERGTGLLKLNVKALDGTGARLVMRKDAVYTLLLNATLFHGMHCSVAQDPRYLKISAIENGAIRTYNLKVASAKIAGDLLEEIKANIPT